MTNRRTFLNSKHALYLRGFKRAPITDIRLEHCSFDTVAQPNLVENVERLVFRDVRINGQERVSARLEPKRDQFQRVASAPRP